ncbi:phosphoribosylglycinamide formyltransferase [Biformimicrobium ophioploci]|uniref:Phosphoribosylglycinamide formyltransferase n=1 Tax=Biformimicrobium ophioploci TaxID=3036711 RepID=A0ABQ6M2H8_9GAMM|nr:phosphoribosylglycinamide formyltransferase [Microbulbifer sp. NKW57]GMG88554.1 phosphoribosylglycinamide formyltransferase [Microbulbifer sp. NKW57]
MTAQEQTGITPCRIAVLISGNGSNLQALIDRFQNEQHVQIAVVVSNKADAFGLERARRAGIPTKVVPNRSFDTREAFDAALMAAIDQHEVNLVVLAGFMRILTPGFVQHYSGRMLNIHPSLLPKYQGLNTHQRALDAGDKVHGVTVHFVTEELDGGPPVLQATVPVLEKDTADALAERVHVQEHLIYPLAVDWFARGRLAMRDDGCTLDGTLLPPTGRAFTEG